MGGVNAVAQARTMMIETVEYSDTHRDDLVDIPRKPSEADTAQAMTKSEWKEDVRIENHSLHFEPLGMDFETPICGLDRV